MIIIGVERNMGLTFEEVELLYEALESYIHTEKSCGGGVSQDYMDLHQKLLEHLHG